MKKNGMTTMQMIAERAGVSVMTVSLALRNHSRVSIETRERIRMLAKKMGYRPNPLVSALMARRGAGRAMRDASVLAFIITHPEPWVYEGRNTWLGEIHLGALERAEALGFRMGRFLLDGEKMTSSRLRNILRARGIRGVVLAPLSEPIRPLAFDWAPFSCAAIGYSYRESELHRAAQDQFGIIRQAVRRLSSLGYERIGLAIRNEDDQRVSGKWTGGFLSFHPYLPVNRRIPVFLWHFSSADRETDHPVWEGPREPSPEFRKWMERWRPDAILFLQPIVLLWVRTLGLRVPEDVGLASLELSQERDLGNLFGSTREGDLTRRKRAAFSGIDQNHPAVGAAAVELVVEQLYANVRGAPTRAKTVLIDGLWVDGCTTRQLGGWSDLPDRRVDVNAPSNGGLSHT